MRRPDATWEAEYAHDRRKHRHRCRSCNRMIDAGERVVMARTRRGSVAMHAACADLGANRDKMKVWGLEGLKARGWSVPELDAHY